MSESNNNSPNGAKTWRTDRDEFTNAVRRAMERAVPAAIREHHLAGDPVTVSHNGQLMHYHPDGTYTPLTRKPPILE